MIRFSLRNLWRPVLPKEIGTQSLTSLQQRQRALCFRLGESKKEIQGSIAVALCKNHSKMIRFGKFQNAHSSSLS
jgi:hypothetical protein